MQFHWTTTTQSPVYQHALAIRTTVFVEEQNVPLHIEIDNLENKCHHLVIYDNDNQPLGTGRLFVQDNYAKIQRVAVLPHARGKHIGQHLIQALEEQAKSLAVVTLKLGAQNHAIPFYQKLGYMICSKEYEDANIKHHDMMKIL